MKKILSIIKENIFLITIIIILLVIQGISLFNIINIGIKQYGIDNTKVKYLDINTIKCLSIILDDKDFINNYKLINDKDIYVLTKRIKDTKKYQAALVLYTNLLNNQELKKYDINEITLTYYMKASKDFKIRDEYTRLQNMNNTLLKHNAINSKIYLYKRLNIDINKIQAKYIIKEVLKLIIISIIIIIVYLYYQKRKNREDYYV